MYFRTRFSIWLCICIYIIFGSIAKGNQIKWHYVYVRVCVLDPWKKERRRWRRRKQDWCFHIHIHESMQPSSSLPWLGQIYLKRESGRFGGGGGALCDGCFDWAPRIGWYGAWNVCMLYSVWWGATVFVNIKYDDGLNSTHTHTHTYERTHSFAWYTIYMLCECNVSQDEWDGKRSIPEIVLYKPSCARMRRSKARSVFRHW